MQLLFILSFYKKIEKKREIDNEKFEKINEKKFLNKYYKIMKE